MHGRPEGCACQYGLNTPRWYISVKYCPVHAAGYTPEDAPSWAATSCGPEGREVWADKIARKSESPLDGGSAED